MLILLASVALIAIVVIGLTSASGGDSSTDPPDSLADARKELAGAPAPLAAPARAVEHPDRRRLPAFEQRIAALKGHPIVVNKWASWCAPCRVEFPVFESIASKRGKEVAFLGINSKDKDAAAKRLPVRAVAAVPVLQGPRREDRREAEGRQERPDHDLLRQGRQDRQGPLGTYKSDKQLNDDIDRYLGAAGTS